MTKIGNVGMGWFREWFQRDAIAAENKVLRELGALNNRVDELVRQNALLLRLDALDARLDKFEERTSARFETIDASVTRDEGTSEADGSRWLKSLETQLTEGRIKWAFFGAAAVMVFVVLFFVFIGDSKAAVDAAAYLFPCCAAIAAGMTAYIERRKGLLFVVSLFLLFLGIDMFLVNQSDSAETTVFTTMLTVGLIDIALVVLAIQAIRAALNSGLDKIQRRQAVWRESLAYFFVLTVAIGSSGYAATFVRKNYACIHPGTPVVQCHGVWRWPLSTRIASGDET